MSKVDWKNISIKELAGLISAHLNKNGIKVILVGGACVTIYSKNNYMSYDLDFVTHSRIVEIKPLLEGLGFIQEGSRHFANESCDYYIEFLTPPVSIGNDDSITHYSEIKTKRGIIKMFTPTDCVKDRLAAYYHWGDNQSLEQALLVAKNQKVNIKDVEAWSKSAKKMDEFKEFKELLNE